MTEEQEALEARLTLLVPINNLEPQQQQQVLKSSKMLEIRRKDYIFRQGDRDNWSFYVIEGQVEMVADDQLIKRVVGGEGSSFHALAQLQPRQMSARAKTKVKVLRADRGLLDRLLSVENNPVQNAPDIEVTEIETSASGDWLTDMLQSELFAHVPPSNIQKLLETLESVEFKAGDVVIEQGAPGDYYYAIQSGRCEVLRTVKNKKPIKLAELEPGARFGEEALVSNAKRNATVKMLTDGELARLTKDDFIALIKTPVMRTCTLDEARSAVADGALWLDVRFPEEQAANGLEGSINIPLSNLRGSHEELDREQHYIVYCDTGGRSSAATFLLAEEGFDVTYVEGGAIDEVPAEKVDETTAAKKPATAKPVAKKPAAKTPEPPAAPRDEIMEADIRAQSLAADLEKAKLKIAQAERVMAEAQAAKQAADRLVAEKLKSERAKIDQEAAAVQVAKQEADLLVAEKLKSERAKIDRQAAAVETRLAEAQRLKDEIERQQTAAAREAEQRHREQEEQTSELERAAEARLQEEQDRIEELYRQQAEKLDELEQEREKSKSELNQAWENIEVESTLSKERLEAAKELENELLRKEQQRAVELEEKERQMRAALQAELENERKKLEAEFARTAEEIERARRAQEAAAAAKKAAAEEAQRIIEEYKHAQDQLQADQHEKILTERRQIEADAAHLKVQLEEAARARTEAEAIKREAETQLLDTRQRHRSIETTEASLRDEIAAIEERARQATERLRNAVAVESNTEDDIRESEKRLERTYGTEKEINLLLQQELDEWVSEQERIQGSTSRRGEMEKQLRQTERIKSRAVEAKRDSAMHDDNLLDEIAAQLGSDT